MYKDTKLNQMTVGHSRCRSIFEGVPFFKGVQLSCLDSCSFNKNHPESTLRVNPTVDYGSAMEVHQQVPPLLGTHPAPFLFHSFLCHPLLSHQFEDSDLYKTSIHVAATAHRSQPRAIPEQIL
jgi:hypothetical protein